MGGWVLIEGAVGGGVLEGLNGVFGEMGVLGSSLVSSFNMSGWISISMGVGW